MHLLLAILSGITFGALLFSIMVGTRLWKWERQLSSARIVVAYKGRVRLNARMIDWLKWANSLDSDESARGHTIYKVGGTTLAILKPPAREHGKTTTKTIKTDG